MRHQLHIALMRELACFKPTRAWSPANTHCYADFRAWLAHTHGLTMVRRYTAAAHWVFCQIDKPYWQINSDDLSAVRQAMSAHVASPFTLQGYRNGLALFDDFLRLKCHTPPPIKPVPWSRFLAELPPALGDAIRAFLAQCQTRWNAHTCYERSLDTLSTLTRPLRLIHHDTPLSGWLDLTPKRWWRYTEMRLANHIATRTLNAEMHLLQACVRFVSESDDAVCEPFLRVTPFPPTHTLPKDAPLDSVRRLLRAAQAQCARDRANQSRLGRLDCAWILLMLHCGLRTGEVRRLMLADIDWERRFILIQHSKGLKDRRVPLSAPVLDALRAYLAVRGPTDMLPPQLFVFQHLPLSRPFCRSRLRYYGRLIHAHITPHQLRHTCATLLLNAGAPVTTVRLILGHVHTDTTLGYARVYDGTLAADYTRAMLSVE